MSQALLHALARPLGLRVGGLGCVAWRALTRTPTPSNKTALSCRAAVAVRWCSGPTTFRQHSYITGGREEDSEKDILGPQSLTPHQTDLEDTTAAQDFLLPSQEQRHQSDRLVDKIKECESVDDGLDVYRRHSEVMSARHYLALIRKLGDLVSNSPEEVALVHGQEEFRALCGQLFGQCRRMDVEELVYLLKHLSRLEVPPTSKLTQAVLQTIENRIKNQSRLILSLFLEFLLKKMSLTPLADALLTAIPILISNALATTQITDLFFSDLTQAFTICSQGQVTGAGVLLQEMYRRGSIRSVPLAMSVVWALTQLSSPRLQRKLLSREEQLTREVIMKECLEILAQETDALTPQQVESTLSKVSVGHDLGDRSCYNERFLHAAATAVCHHSMSFEKTAHAIRKTCL
ncbi:hypothetical protein GWK47_028062 [Chionoecetes opilio]|uniref:Uncharacterized protein n=1 Tax=Chionoecetes opilio TaxID=41210 RepID=A0A8J4YYY3_CHIOP|nr:hypothetical protein GWK47_028062 [Chionoecetes opilio]